MKSVRLWALILLLFLGVGGIAGGVPMIIAAYWTQWGIMPTSLLQYSPFHSFLIPGLILLATNGLLPLWIYLRVKRRQPLCGLWTAFQGCLLFGWMTVECVMLRMLVWPQVFYFVIALLLIIFGFLLNRRPAPGIAHG